MNSELRQYTAQLLEPEPKLSVWEWCEQNLYLSGRVTDNEGMYSTTLYPFVREILECFADYSVSDVCMMTSAQVAKTTTYMAGMAWTIHNRNQSIIFAMDSESNVKSLSKNRWLPMVDDCPVLAAHKPSNEDNYQILEQQFDTCTVRLVGAGSPGRLASTPSPIVIADEVDKYPVGNEREASAVKLLDERTMGFALGKRFKASTPTNEDGVIYQEWLRSDQRKYFVPCPHCGEMILLEWKLVKWDQSALKGDDWDIVKASKSAYIECPCCAGHVHDGDKTKMLRDGEWRPTNPNADPLRRGYHINRLYSPTSSLRKMVSEFLRAKDNPEYLRNFVNSWLGEPWKEKTIAHEPSKLQQTEGDHYRCEPVGDVRVMTVDTQRADLRYNIRGYDHESKLIDYGEAATWDEIEKLQEDADCAYVFIDTGGTRTQEVYEIIHKNRKRKWYGIKGFSPMVKPYAYELLDPFVGKKRGGRIKINAIPFLKVNVDVWRNELARCRIGERPHWKVFKDTPHDYVNELFAERQIEKYVKGRRTIVWKPKHGAPNHQFDLEVYQLAASAFLKLGGKQKLKPTIFAKKDKSEEVDIPVPTPKPQQGTPAPAQGTTQRKYIPLSQRRQLKGDRIF